MISSTINSHMISLCTVMVYWYCCSCSVKAKNNITNGEFMNDGHNNYLESHPGNKFQMGFFQQGNTSELRRYVAIWYTMDPETVVWVANRDNPVLDSTGVVTVAKDGNFKVVNKDKSSVYFSTAIEGAPVTVLKLLDTGNAVLINVASGSMLWQSFENPTDTFLPGMIMGTDINLTSWKSATDPGSGSFVFQTDIGMDQYSILNGPTTVLWKSGKKSTNSFDDNQIFSKALYLLSNTTTQKRNTTLKNGTISSETYMVVDPNSRLVMGHSGKLQYFSGSGLNSQWVTEWEEPKDACSFYKVCGAFGMCKENNGSSVCNCLPGFEPVSPDDYSQGCKRTSEICDKSVKETFINITMISMDDTTVPFFKSNNESDCIRDCLKDCNCLAYSYSSQNEEGIRDPNRQSKHGCWFWDTEPNNLKGEGTHNISFRVAESLKVKAKDNITKGESMNDGHNNYLESHPGNKFQMGFFQQGNTSELRRYVAIWYTMDPETVVWVANRDKPVLDSTGVVTVAKDGNFKVVNKNESSVYFSTAIEGTPITVLKLLDTGNAVLINVASGSILWQSFENPTDTFLPGMIMGTDIKLTSWKSATDPGSGSFEFQADTGTAQYSILNGSTTFLWKSSKNSTNSFDDNQIFSEVLHLLSNTTTQKRNTTINNGTRSHNTLIPNHTSETYMVIDPNSRLVMGHSGKLQYFSWSGSNSQWVTEWEEPKDACSFYKVCGPFGMCKENNGSSACSCLLGFEPVSPDDYSQGCKRTSEICDKSVNDTFINITIISMDDTNVPFFKSNNESDCIRECLKDCNCLAYSYSSQNEEGIRNPNRQRQSKHGCWFWDTIPNNLKGEGTHNISLHNISFRVAESLKEPSINTPPENQKTERKSSSRKRVLAISIVGSAMVLSLFCCISYITYKRLVNRNKRNNTELQSYNKRTHINELLNLDHSKEDDTEGLDVPLFELERIIDATNDFSEENRLGEGGFGPVYKGKLPGGQEIAVKRLSSLSGQGLQEFKNEVTLIAKLQHRNLVRLLGYCIRGEEKMLLYEYMPNRSLDLFIFDQTLGSSLNWEMRFHIIVGIARGLNYLHHDSRLRIIHRDLKTSNILLDEDMNPKISDFGLARIVKGKDIEDITNRVVGTFGYMSPEYALDGVFSIKSDVFSFGVVLLEILSGKRNTGFYQAQKRTSLLGHAWSLWIEERPFELLDQTLMESCSSSEVLKCICVGLMCVQGDPDDRPTMTNVVMMLGGDMATFPNPKEPVVIPRRDPATSSYSSSSKLDTQTKNMLTLTEVAGR